MFLNKNAISFRQKWMEIAVPIALTQKYFKKSDQNIGT
jgi:hypothetical protein